MKNSLLLHLLIFVSVQFFAIALYFVADSYLAIQMPEHKAIAIIAAIFVWSMFFIYEYANRRKNEAN